MASDTAGKWVLLITLYVIVFTLVIQFTANWDDSVSIEGNIIDNYYLFGSDNLNYSCTTPRFKYDVDFELVPNFATAGYNCEDTLGVTDQETCNLISGCNWTTTTIRKYFIVYSDITTCTGYVNLSYYDEDNSSYPNLCAMSELQDVGNSDLCTLLGCTANFGSDVASQHTILKANSVWDKITAPFKMFGLFISTIVELFTFQVNIGLPPVYNVFFLLFFFHLPNLIGLLAIMIYIRG